MSKLISVVVPTCNDRTEFLREAVASISAQTFQPHEVLIINNGQTSLDSNAVDSRCSVHNIVALAGVAQARNFGAAAATGQYIAFLDDDDLWETTYLEHVAKELETGSICVVSRLDQLIDGSVRRFKSAKGKMNVGHLFTHNPGVGGSNVVIEKSLFLRCGGYDVRLLTSEDKSLMIEVLRAGVTPSFVDRSAAIARHHEGARLSDSIRMIQGKLAFLSKYQEHMSYFQLLLNKKTIARHQASLGMGLGNAKLAYYKTLIKFVSAFKSLC